jgi:phage I-like protein
MNPRILNREFQHPTDGWYQIEALGAHPNAAAGVVQVIDAEAAQAITQRFNAEAAAGQLRHGQELLIDHEHFSDQPDQETRAYGWLQELQPREDGIYGRIRWTSTGRLAVDGGDYRFFSTEYEPADLVAVDVNPWLTNSKATKAVRPLRLAGLTLTNMNNNRGQKPITNRGSAGEEPQAEVRLTSRGPGKHSSRRALQDFASSREPADSNPPPLRCGAAGKTNKVENKKMKTVCTLLGLAAEADEVSAHDALTKLLNRTIELEQDNQTLLAEQLDSLLAEHTITDPKVINRLKPVLNGLKNREERLVCLADFGFKVGGLVAAPRESAANSAPARILNRGAGSSALTSVTGDADEKTIAQKLKNRAHELQVHGRSFDSAWQQAMQEVAATK